MNWSFRRPRQTAAVFAAALNSWTVTTRGDETDQALLLVVRRAPDGERLRSSQLSDRQVTRLLGLLRDDLVRAATPTQAGAAVDQILAEWRAEGRHRIEPRDWLDQLPRIGRTRQWLAHHLVHLADSGYLRETRRPGTYRL